MRAGRLSRLVLLLASGRDRCPGCARRGSRRRRSPPSRFGAAIDQLGIVRLPGPQWTPRARPPGRAREVAVPALIAGGPNARRRLRALPRAGPALRLQRSAHARRDGADARRQATIGSAPWPTRGSSTIPTRRSCRGCSTRCDTEESEFVRPALTRALAALRRRSPRRKTLMTTLVMRGQDFFRSVVIEALGDYRAAYALKPITEVAKLDGPLQDDAVLALGKIGDKRVAGDARGSSADGAARIAAVDRRGDLPARRQLRVAPAVHRPSR